MPTFGSIVRISSLTSFILLAGPAAQAAPPTKEECVDAHGKGQDARESGQLAQASRLFFTCAQSSCPDLVRSDCARFADEIERQKSTVTFAARDSAQADLPDTSVYVDGKLVASQLGDGKAHEIDPGRHEVRFVHAGKETIVSLVVNQGEKGRTVVGTFASAPLPAPTPATNPGAPQVPQPDVPELKRPAGPLILVGLGAAAAVTGGVLLGVGFGKIPANCSLSTHECSAPPKDPSFDQASSGVTLVNVGGIVGGVGVLTLASSLIWYFAQPLRPAKPVPAALVPWVGPQGAGLSFTGAL
jgi:hypothetical protein